MYHENFLPCPRHFFLLRESEGFKAWGQRHERDGFFPALIKLKYEVPKPECDRALCVRGSKQGRDQVPVTTASRSDGRALKEVRSGALM